MLYPFNPTTNMQPGELQDLPAAFLGGNCGEGCAPRIALQGALPGEAHTPLQHFPGDPPFCCFADGSQCVENVMIS
jgi:hypothetical protein